MTALKAGVSLSSVRRPLKGTEVVCESFEKLQEATQEPGESQDPTSPRHDGAIGEQMYTNYQYWFVVPLIYPVC